MPGSGNGSRGGHACSSPSVALIDFLTVPHLQWLASINRLNVGVQYSVQIKVKIPVDASNPGTIGSVLSLKVAAYLFLTEPRATQSVESLAAVNHYRRPCLYL